MLALGLLVAAFGVIYAFTPGGFSWQLELVALLLILPWLTFERGRRLPRPAAGKTGIPRWHPESEVNDR